MLNHGCGGAETLCLISNSLDGVCQCPANMFKRVEQDLAGQNRETCISELPQHSCHILTPSHLHTFSYLSTTSLITPSHYHFSLPHFLTPSLSLAGASSLLLIATQEAIHYLPIHTDVSPAISRPLPIGPLYDVSAVAYDPVNKSVLWIDRETQFLNG